MGIDEVGRGSWAGPLVVGAVVLGGMVIDGLTDSKKLTKKRRESLDFEIRKKAKSIGLGWVDSNEIDEIGLSEALKLATRHAVEQINVPYHEIIIDGNVNFLTGTAKENIVKTMKKADLLIPCVSAASIVAKVARDRYMTQQDKAHRGYKFNNNVGYGTAAHQVAINKLGVTKLHRLSFAPLKKYFTSQTPPDVSVTTVNDVTTKQIGDSAEDVAAKYLKKKGHKILNRNWKTKFCEIDIVSSKSDTIYFTEVKYRKKPDQGGGLGAITPRKIRQMKFAVKLYVLSNKINDVNLRMSAISLSGQPPTVDDFVKI